MYGLFEFIENLNSTDTLNVQNCVNSTGNCVRQMYRLFEFAEKLNIKNCVKSTVNCVHYMNGLSGFVENEFLELR